MLGKLLARMHAGCSCPSETTLTASTNITTCCSAPPPDMQRAECFSCQGADWCGTVRRQAIDSTTERRRSSEH